MGAIAVLNVRTVAGGQGARQAPHIGSRAACCAHDIGASFSSELSLKPPLSLQHLFDQLLETFGPQGWWPTTPSGQSRPRYHPEKKPRRLAEIEQWEIMVGAILTQNTSWRNVESALAALWEEGLMDRHAMSRASLDHLATTVRPSGYFNQKAARLQFLASYIDDHPAGSLGSFLRLPAEELRAELLSLNGIGPETADSMLLYAAQIPRFVVDAYATRILGRLGLASADAEYDELQQVFESALPTEHELYNECHALLVRLATTWCKSKPDCEACCLNECCNYFREQYRKRDDE